jgi:large subunit ribosomal protein L17
MRHLNAGSKLGRQPAHRRATLRSLVTNVIEHESIQTTITRARAARPLVEHLVTLGKRDTLHTRRQAAAFLLTAAATQKLFRDLAPRFSGRNGGYTRIVRSGWRISDGAQLAILEFVDFKLKKKEPKKKEKAAEEKPEEAKAEAKG